MNNTPPRVILNVPVPREEAWTLNFLRFMLHQVKLIQESGGLVRFDFAPTRCTCKKINTNIPSLQGYYLLDKSCLFHGFKDADPGSTYIDMIGGPEDTYRTSG